MKSHRIPVQNHPIMKRLLQYRQLICDQSVRFSSIVLPQIDQILSSSTSEKYVSDQKTIHNFLSRVYLYNNYKINIFVVKTIVLNQKLKSC